MRDSSPTDGADTERRPAARPAPLGAARLAEVPGVLGDICRSRRGDYPADSGDAAAVMPTAAGSLFRQALRGEPLAIIAEVKRASPSRGPIADLDPVEAATSYLRGGAHALSVLTEERHFGGSLAHLEAVAAAVPLPVLRKDFTVHPLQIEEAAAAGAGAVLLIAAVLGARLGEYIRYSEALGLAALVEVHSEAELDLALEAGADLLGVNNRDLHTLEIDLGTAPRLLGAARARGFRGIGVAESGYADPEQLRPLVAVADAVLIGSSLAGSGDLSGSLARLLAGVAS